MRARVLFKIVYILLLLALVGSITLIIVGLDSTPLVESAKALSTRDVERAKQLIKRHDPRKLKAGEVKKLEVSDRDLNLIFQHGLSRLPVAGKMKSQIDLTPNVAKAAFTFTLPANPIGSYLNITTILSKSPEGMVVDRITIGPIVLRSWLIQQVMSFAHQYLKRYEEYQDIVEATESIKDFEFREKELLLVYQWSPDVARKLKSRGQKMLISEQDKARLLAYDECLIAVSKTISGRKGSLVDFSQPLFSCAKERSDSLGDPVSENRAAIIVLAMYVNRKSLEKLVGREEGERYPQPEKRIVTLRDRRDLAQHFTVSAALDAAADSTLANVLGLFKEIDDSRGGSGFSFADLAADRAGVRFAELSTKTPQQAQFVQEQMREVTSESDFMPRIDGLPEGIMEAEFKKKYRDLDSESFRSVKDEIERRIAECRIYR